MFGTVVLMFGSFYGILYGITAILGDSQIQANVMNGAICWVVFTIGLAVYSAWTVHRQDRALRDLVRSKGFDTIPIWMQKFGRRFWDVKD